MPAKPALTFDPRYVDFAITAWNRIHLVPVLIQELKDLTANEAEQQFTHLTEMGVLEEDVAPDKVDKAINTLKTLKITAEKKVGPKEAKITQIAPTPRGKSILDAPPASGGIRTSLVQNLVGSSDDLYDFVNALVREGPLAIPSFRPLPEAPKKKAEVLRAATVGLAQFCKEYRQTITETTGTPQAQIKSAAAVVLSHHSAGKLKNFEKLAELAASLGLIWVQVRQISSVVAAKVIGSAAVRLGETMYIPNAPDWNTFSSTFITYLIESHTKIADSTGFATIEDLRGALGQSLSLSAPVVDDFLRRARDAGDRRKVPVRLHFEEDEELLYKKGRNPLIWNGHAYDFVEVSAIPAELNGKTPTGAMFRRV